MRSLRVEASHAADAFLRSRYALLERVCDVKQMRDEAAALAAARGVDVTRENGLVYRVVPGDALRGTRLARFYASPALRRLVELVTGSRVFPSPHVRSAVNVNHLGAPGDRYRMHFDAHPHSALLFLTDADPEDGGDLLLRPPDRDPIAIRPCEGLLVLFDGTAVEHGVAPIRRACERLSVPMVFPTDPLLPRPNELDEDLYGPSLTR